MIDENVKVFYVFNKKILIPFSDTQKYFRALQRALKRKNKIL